MDERTKLEIQRSHEVAARRALSREFNPEHTDGIGATSEGARPSPDNKAYRERMGAQLK